MKKKSFWIILVLLIIVIIVIANLSKGKKVEYVTDKVVKNTLTQTVSETGAIESASALDLNFKATGTLKEILVKAGDEVVAGQILASLNAGDLEIQVRQAQANVDIARANLNRLLAGASLQDIKVTEETVNNAKIAYDNAQKDYDNLMVKINADIKTFQETADFAQISLTNTQNTYAKTKDDAKQTLITTIRSKANAANTTLDFIDYQFTNLGNVADYQAKINTWDYYTQALEKQTSLNNLLNYSDQTVAQKLSEASSLAIGLLEDMNLSLNSLYNTISSSVVDARFSQLKIDNDKALVKAEQTTNSANLAALQAADQSYKTAELAYTSAIDGAQSNLTTAQNNLNSALASKDVQIDQAKSGVDTALGTYKLAKAQLDFKKAAPRMVDISYYQAQVDQAQASLDLAINKLNDYMIIAPKDGFITFVNYKVGEQIGLGTGLVSTTSNNNAAISMLGKNDFQIKVDVPESDIVKVKIDNPVKITLDAYGDDLEFTGKVTYVDVAETLISDVVYYKVTVSIDQTDFELKSGMTANVDILTAQKENVLLIPSRAVKETETGQKYVELLKHGKPEKVNVTTGLKGDQGKIEIVAGLKEGEEVIIYKKES